MKKKNLFLAAAAALLLIIFPVSASAVSGDIDGDSVLSSGDARLVLRVSVKTDSLNGIYNYYADADNDGKITAGDARLILRASVNLGTLPDKYYISRAETANADKKTISVYDSSGRLTEEKSVDAQSGDEITLNTYKYTENGILRSIKSPEGLNTFTITSDEEGGYEASGRLPDGSYIKKFYGPAPAYNLLRDEISDENKNAVSVIRYDIFGRTESVTDAGGTLKFKYGGPGGRLSEKTEPYGRRTVYSYRDDGRIEKLSFYDGEELLYYFSFIASDREKEKAAATAVSSDVDSGLTACCTYDGANLTELRFYTEYPEGEVPFYPVEKKFYEKF